MSSRSRFHRTQRAKDQEEQVMRKLSKRIAAVAGATVLAAAGAATIAVTGASAGTSVISFHMVRSATAVGANCLNGAQARVTIRSQGPVEVMRVSADHLPRNTDFDLFVIQVPNAPFGMSWYQGTWKATATATPRARSSGGSASRPSPWHRVPRRLPRYTAVPSRTRRRTRRSAPCTPTTWACGSTRRRTPSPQAARARPRRSMVTTPPACRR